MLRLKIGSDAIQMGILSLGVLTALVSVMLWVDARYAKASDVQSLSEEVHALYLHLIPERERPSHPRGEVQ